MSGIGSQQRRGTLLAPMLVGGLMVAASVGITAYINFGGLHMTKSPIYPENNRQVSTLPTETEHWRRLGPDKISSSEIVETLGTQNYVSRNYILKESEGKKKPVIVEFHAAYYTGMIDTVPHVPERCFVGGGMQQSVSPQNMVLEMNTNSWRSDNSVPPELSGLAGTLYSVRLTNNRKWTDAPGSRIRLPRDVTPETRIMMRCSEFILGDDQKIYAGYFFIANGGTKANANEVRTLAFNLSDDYAYYLKIQVNCLTADSIDEFAEYAGSVIGDLLGEIMRCAPDWVEVQEGRYPAVE